MTGTADDFIIVTEEQAARMEKAGIPVEIQYVVRLNNLKAVPEAAERPRTRIPERVIRYGRDAMLRWTGLKWSGQLGTQAHEGYMILADHFKGRDVKATVVSRSDINALLANAFQSRGKVLHANVVTSLCDQKYLELTTVPAKK